MKISSIIFGIAVLIGIANCGSTVEHIEIGDNFYIEKAYDVTYFTLPTFQNDVMAFDVAVLKPYDFTKFDFSIAIKGFSVYPSDEEISYYDNGYVPLVNYRLYQDVSGYDIYSYPFRTTNNVAFLGFYFYSNSQYSLYINIRSESKSRETSFLRRLNLLQEIKVDFAYGSYFFGISALENDKVAFEIKALKPYYFDNDFKVYTAGFSNDYPSDSELTTGSTYTPLTEYNYYSYSEYDLYSYPFETTENVHYLGFYLETAIQSPILIYIKSEKAELAAGFIALIVIGVILLIAGIGAGVTFLIRKFGCWVRIHSSDI